MSALDLGGLVPRTALRSDAADPRGARAAAPAGSVMTGRDLRLDMFRGLALLMIFIDHVPGTIFESYTIRNYGFSDAAEAFVFMSGMAAGLAYSSRFLAGQPGLGFLKIWARARQLYFVHMTTTAMAIAIVAAGALWYGVPQMLGQINMGPILAQPLGAMVGLPLMTHQLGYFNILPLYIALLVFTPLMLMVAVRRPWWLLCGSIALWMLAGQFRLNFPNFPTRGGWFFNPLSWQLIFVVGLLSGTAMKQGTRFVPIKPWLFWAATAMLVFILAWVKIDALGAAGRSVLDLLSRAGLPFYVTWFDKTFLALPRLLHALALVYVLSCLAPIRQVAESPLARPLVIIGQHGLPVFALGSVLSIALQAVTARADQDFWSDILLLSAGVLLQLALAVVLSRVAAMQGRTRSGSATSRAAQ